MLVEKLGSANMAVQETARDILELWLSGSDAVSVLPQLVLAPAHANARLRSQAVSLIIRVSWPSPMQVDAFLMYCVRSLPRPTACCTVLSCLLWTSDDGRASTCAVLKWNRNSITEISSKRKSLTHPRQTCAVRIG